LGAPASALGVIAGVSDALAGAARLGGGALADDAHRRRSVAVGGYTTTAVLSAGIGACTGAVQVAVLRAGAWTARGLRVPARNALLADIVPAQAYGRAYGFERAMDNLGTIVGPLLAIVLVCAVGTRWAIGLSVIPGLLAAAAIIFAIRHTATPRERQRRPIRLRVRPVMRGRLGRLMLGIAAFEVGNCAATLLILRATDLFADGRSEVSATQLAILLYVAYNLAATVVSIPAGRHGDRHDATRVLATGAACFASAYVWFGSALTVSLHSPPLSSSLGSASVVPRPPSTPLSRRSHPSRSPAPPSACWRESKPRATSSPPRSPVSCGP
jgi:MFS family permease